MYTTTRMRLAVRVTTVSCSCGHSRDARQHQHQQQQQQQLGSGQLTNNEGHRLAKTPPTHPRLPPRPRARRNLNIVRRRNSIRLRQLTSLASLGGEIQSRVKQRRRFWEDELLASFQRLKGRQSSKEKNMHELSDHIPMPQ